MKAMEKTGMHVHRRSVRRLRHDRLGPCLLMYSLSTCGASISQQDMRSLEKKRHEKKT